MSFESPLLGKAIFESSPETGVAIEDLLMPAMESYHQQLDAACMEFCATRHVSPDKCTLVYEACNPWPKEIRSPGCEPMALDVYITWPTIEKLL